MFYFLCYFAVVTDLENLDKLVHFSEKRLRNMQQFANLE